MITTTPQRHKYQDLFPRKQFLKFIFLKKSSSEAEDEIEKYKFHKSKCSISINNIYINKIVVSNKVSSGNNSFKYFIGSEKTKKIRPLCIFLPKMSAYRKDFHKTKYMSFLIKDNELLEKYNEIWKKVSNSMKKGFDGEPACNEMYLKTKIKSCKGKINTNFHNNKIPKLGSQCISLSVMLIDFVFRIVYLEECKNVVQEKRYLTILLAI